MSRRKTPPDDKRLLVLPSPVTISPEGGIEDESGDDGIIRRITKENLSQYQENVLVANADRLIPEMMSSLSKQVKSGNIKAIEMVAQMYNYLSRGSGINIVTNIQQNNTTTVNNSADGISFDSIVRKLDDKYRESKDEDITDAEVIQ